MSKSKKKKSRPNLPKELIYIPNADKDWHEEWDSSDNEADFPAPVRLLACSGGRPNMRKTNTLKNVIIRQCPAFEVIYIVHCGGELTKEYDEFNAICLDDLPDPCDKKLFDRKVKTLLVLEDLNFEGMNRMQRKKLDRLYGFTSTHLNVSIFCTSQGFFAIPPLVRKMSNVLFIWKTLDMDSLETIRRRVDIPKDQWRYIFETYFKNPWDFLVVDNTKNTRWPLRMNLFEPIDVPGYDQ